MPARPKIKSSVSILHRHPPAAKSAAPLITTVAAPVLNRKNARKHDVAREFNVCVRTVDQWLHDRRIPCRKISPRVVRFDLDAVERALSRYTVREVS
jgi:hypothetical protein